jgi:hypothetical protein
MLATLAAAVAVFALAGEVAAQTRSGWLLVTPPPVPERRMLIKVYAANSDSEVQAAVASLPGEEQVRLVTKVYKILNIAVPADRTEALLAALQDTAAPVSRWRTLERFDSATSCEQKRERALQSFERAAAKVRSESPEDDELAVEDWTILEGLAACRMSRCVPESTLSLR